MHTYSTRIRPSDVEMIEKSARRHNLDKSKLYRRCLNYAVLAKPKPRSLEAIPCKALKEVAFSAKSKDMQRWREAARERGLPYHLWLRECVVPLMAMDLVPLEPDFVPVNPTQEEIFRQLDADVADPVAPFYSERRAKTPVTIGIRTVDAKRRQYQIAARSQQLSVNKWIIEVLDQASAYHIQHPK